MAAPTPYLHLSGTALAALNFYADVFGGTAIAHSFSDFGRSDGPGDAIAHGYLVDGPIDIFAADVGGDEVPLRTEGVMFALLGVAPPSQLRQWFSRLAEGGRVVDELQRRPWGAHDGQVIDQFGVHWLIGFEGAESN